MNYKMNRLLRVMLIICITILLSVHNLCAQEVWEELAEQLMDEDENSSFQWDTHLRSFPNYVKIPSISIQQLKSNWNVSISLWPTGREYIVLSVQIWSYAYPQWVMDDWRYWQADYSLFTTLYLLWNSWKEQYKPNIKRILKYGKQELSTRVDIPFIRRPGINSTRQKL